MTKSCGWVDEGPLRAMTGAPPRGQRREDRPLVARGLAASDEDRRELPGGRWWGIGDPAFQARRRALHRNMAMGVGRPEEVAFRRVAPQVDPAAGLQAVAALLRGRLSGMNPRDGAGDLGVERGSAVGRMRRRLREQRAEAAVRRPKPARFQAMRTQELRRGSTARLSIVRLAPIRRRTSSAKRADGCSVGL